MHWTLPLQSAFNVAISVSFLSISASWASNCSHFCVQNRFALAVCCFSDFFSASTSSNAASFCEAASSSERNSSSVAFRFVNSLQRPSILRRALLNCSVSVSTSLGNSLVSRHDAWPSDTTLSLLTCSISFTIIPESFTTYNFESALLTTTWILQDLWPSSINFLSTTCLNVEADSSAMMSLVPLVNWWQVS